MSFDLKCYSCGSKTQILIEGICDTRLGQAGAYSIRQCSSCGLGLTVPVPSDLGASYEKVIPDRSKSLYRNIYRRIAHSMVGVHMRLSLDRAGRFLEMIAESPKEIGTKVLDIGCGLGDWMIILKKMGFEVFGVDSNPKAVDIAQARGLKVKLHSAQEVDQLGMKFDLVIMSQILEHIEKPRELLDSVQEVLKKDGWLLIAVPNLASRYRKYFKEQWINWYVPLHFFHFTLESLQNILTSTGYRLLKSIDYTPPSWWLNSVLLKIMPFRDTRNKNLFAWWTPMLYPLLVPYVTISDIRDPGHGDCLCILAQKVS